MHRGRGRVSERAGDQGRGFAGTCGWIVHATWADRLGAPAAFLPCGGNRDLWPLEPPEKKTRASVLQQRSGFRTPAGPSAYERIRHLY